MKQLANSRFRYSSPQFDSSEDGGGTFEKFHRHHEGAMPVGAHRRSKRSAHKTHRSRQASRKVARWYYVAQAVSDNNQVTPSACMFQRSLDLPLA